MDTPDFSLSIFDNSPQAFCVIKVELDSNGKPEDWTFLYCNDALAKLEGYPKEELTGKRFYGLFPDGDRKWLRPYYEAAYEKKVSSFDSVSDEIGQNLHIKCVPLDGEGICGCMLSPINQLERDMLREQKSSTERFWSVRPAALYPTRFRNIKIFI